MTINQIHKQFQKDYKKGLKELATDELSKAEFMAVTSLKEWDLRKAGGFKALKKLFFPDFKNPVVQAGLATIASYKRQLTQAYGKPKIGTELFITCLDHLLQKNRLKLYKPPAKPKRKKDIRRAVLACLSDTHFGTIIDPKEVGGLNSYNWQVAARRLAFLAQEIIDYKPQYRDNTELVLQINGDIIGGVIHEQEWAVELLAVQFYGALELLSQYVSLLANHFSRIQVVCTPGNHGRAMHKRSTQRAMALKWDSYETMLFMALKTALEHLHNVSILIPKAPYAIYEVLGHTIFQTHGDTVINVGNVGSNIPITRIRTQIHQLNAERPAPKKIRVVCVGHVHVPTVQALDDICSLVINGCLSGVDPYANAIGVSSNFPAQVIFEATPKHPVGDIRIIKVEQADKKKSLEDLIQVPNIDNILE